jgi:hypothetical protein
MQAVKIPTGALALTSLFLTASHRECSDIGMWTCGYQIGTTTVVQCTAMRMSLYLLRSYGMYLVMLVG